MGLAPFGKLDKRAYELMKEMLQVNGLSLRTTAKLFDPRLWQFLSTIDREGLAFTGQQVFEETVLALLRNLRERTRMDCLVYGGGCALNSACNGRIVASTGFHKVHVYAAPADDGNALGAAFLAVKADGGQPDRMTRPLTPFLGSTVSRESLEKLKNFSHKGRVREVGDSIAEVAARAIAQGKVVGWMQGRAEFGPRALGNRSILADPRNDHIKAYLNSQVKSRESFRPFAPAILHEHGNEYFEDYQESPYMERVLKFRAGIITKVPGVVHVDGTGRAQSVFEWMNPAFHALLEQFHQIAGVPVLLNTSLNVMGKPIAHSVEDVLPLLHTTGLHALAIEGLWVEKPEGID